MLVNIYARRKPAKDYPSHYESTTDLWGGKEQNQIGKSLQSRRLFSDYLHLVKMTSKANVTGVKVVWCQLTNDQQTSRENPSYSETKQRNVYKDMRTATYTKAKIFT